MSGILSVWKYFIFLKIKSEISKCMSLVRGNFLCRQFRILMKYSQSQIVSEVDSVFLNCGLLVKCFFVEIYTENKVDNYTNIIK